MLMFVSTGCTYITSSLLTLSAAFNAAMTQVLLLVVSGELGRIPSSQGVCGVASQT